VFNKLSIFVAVLAAIITAAGTREHFTTEQGSVGSGAALQLWVKVTPEDGWKFNAEYPTKVKMKTRGYELVETAVSKQEESTTHTIRAAVKQNDGSAEEAVKMQAVFSICNDASCLVYKKEFTFCLGVTCKE
jgi:hypothetical protein